MSDCPHCPDGHRKPESRHWGAWVAPDRDSDGQPTHLRVEITNGAHVAEPDAEWVRQRLMGDQDSTLGQRLTDLLREFGITEPIASISGGPSKLSVTTYATGADGRKFFGAEDGLVVMHSFTLDVQKGPRQ